MIDLHCHILPGLDDGPATIADSVALARRAVELGTQAVVATPHVSWLYPFEPTTVPEQTAALERELRAAAISLDVVVGAEIALTRLTSLDDAQLRLLCLGQGPYVLVNAPYAPMEDLLEDMLGDLRSRGFRPVLAHPERSPSLQAEPERIARLVDAGVLCSITVGSLRGEFGDPARELALSMFEQGLAHNLASDAHGERVRPPGLREGLEILAAGTDEADWLVRAVPRAILAGDEPPPRPSRRVGADAGRENGAPPVADAEHEPRPGGAGLESNAPPPVAGAKRKPRAATAARARVLLAVAGVAAIALLGLVVATMSASGPAPAPDERSPAAGAVTPQPAPVAVLSYGDGGQPPGGAQAAANVFDAQLEALARAGFEAIDVERFTAIQRGQRVALPRKPVLVTVEQRTAMAIDADRSFVRHGFRGVLFASTAEIGRPGNMTWEQVRLLHLSGRWDLGSQSRNGGATVPTDAQGTQAPFLQAPRWIPAETRVEAVPEYRARLRADLEASVEDFVSRGLPAPRLFAFRSFESVPPGAGQQVPTELREELFRRFAVVMVDSEPAVSHSPGERGGYAPRISAARRSAKELVATVQAAV